MKVDIKRMQERFSFVHYSQDPLGELLSFAQPSGETFKPKGLWVSAEGEGDTWRDWCKAEQFNMERFAFRTQIRFAPGANILWLSSAEEIDAFNAAFGRSERYAFQWGLVAEQWQGLVIAPYQWSRRMHRDVNWYYCWDCASGCIWDSRAISLGACEKMPMQEAAE